MGIGCSSSRFDTGTDGTRGYMLRVGTGSVSCWACRRLDRLSTVIPVRAGLGEPQFRFFARAIWSSSCAHWCGSSYRSHRAIVCVPLVGELKQPG